MKKIDVEKMDAVPGRRLEPGDRYLSRVTGRDREGTPVGQGGEGE